MWVQNGPALCTVKSAMRTPASGFATSGLHARLALLAEAPAARPASSSGAPSKWNGETSMSSTPRAGDRDRMRTARARARADRAARRRACCSAPAARPPPAPPRRCRPPLRLAAQARMWALISAPRRLRSSESASAGSRGPVGAPEQLDQPVPLPLLERQQLDKAVGAGDHPAVAEAALDPVLHRPVAEPLDREGADRERRVLARDVDVLAAELVARPQCGQRAERGGDAALQLGEMAVDLDRRPLGKQLDRQPVGQQVALARGVLEVDVGRPSNRPSGRTRRTAAPRRGSARDGARRSWLRRARAPRARRLACRR